MDFSVSKVIAAVRNQKEFDKAVRNPDINTVFLLSFSIQNITDYVAVAHENHKKIFVHIDFADGVGKDACGVKYVAQSGVDGIISTRNNMIKFAKENGVMTVQRFFIIDSHSFDTALETVKSSSPDFAELMPGNICRQIKEFSSAVSIPVISGGLIKEQSEVDAALAAGATAISTSREELW